MLFHVRMDVALPHAMPADQAAELKRVEKARAAELQQAGTWRHLWRIAGQYSNFSVFDVASTDELHDLLSTLPLFPYMRIEVTPLVRHPSSIRNADF
ncbi:muconolactone Delta-isomerase [Massilia cavernae]|uniref:Muconolactone Delta-isomerase n=1 Tax=Massilia cavernae TaxID=2320864 RepID=A0A418XRD2_9BURK|nr:muconolactone Delta-isomerase [Massilia cavernae]RJG14977.1 muconolactone Delta-isomerase [Massilia cavernae]